MAPSSTFAFFHCHYAFQKFPFFCVTLCVLRALQNATLSLKRQVVMVQFLSINFFSWLSSIFVGFFKSSRFFVSPCTSIKRILPATGKNSLLVHFAHLQSITFPQTEEHQSYYGVCLCLTCRLLHWECFLTFKMRCLCWKGHGTDVSAKVKTTP